MRTTHTTSKITAFENRGSLRWRYHSPDETKASPLSHFLAVEIHENYIGALPTETGLNDLTPLQAPDHPAIDTTLTGGHLILEPSTNLKLPITTVSAHSRCPTERGKVDEAFEAFAYD
jgi:hypothetical protein